MGAAEKQQERLLGVPEVAAVLGISEDLARDLMKRLRPVRIGLGKRQLLKVRARVLERWIQTGGDESWLTSTYADESTGHEGKIDSESGGTAPRNSGTPEPPKLLRPSSSKSSFLTPIEPKTKPRSLKH